jgi:hypothetical protein
MRNLLYRIAGVFVVYWGIGFFGYGKGNMIHLLLVIATIFILFGFSEKEKNA